MWLLSDHIPAESLSSGTRTGCTSPDRSLEARRRCRTSCITTLASVFPACRRRRIPGKIRPKAGPGKGQPVLGVECLVGTAIGHYVRFVLSVLCIILLTFLDLQATYSDRYEFNIALIGEILSAWRQKFRSSTERIYVRAGTWMFLSSGHLRMIRRTPCPMPGSRLKLDQHMSKVSNLLHGSHVFERRNISPHSPGNLRGTFKCAHTEAYTANPNI